MTRAGCLMRRPPSNANFAWVQHMIYHLSANGRAGFVLSNGSMSTNTRGEKEIRQKMIEADLVDCMVALPPQLFSNTQIPACLWFLNKAKPAHRKGQILFIDARHMGYLIDRTLRDLTDEDIAQIAGTYHTWRTGERRLSRCSRASAKARRWTRSPDTAMY